MIAHAIITIIGTIFLLAFLLAWAMCIAAGRDDQRWGRK